MRQSPVSPEEGRAMAEKINAFGYLECSGKEAALDSQNPSNSNQPLLMNFPARLGTNKSVKLILLLLPPPTAKTGEGVREVFETATRAALQIKRRKRAKCVLIQR